MRFSRSIYTVDTHTVGHPTRTVISGVPAIPGANMVEKAGYVADQYSDLIGFLLKEPRGHRAMAGVLLTEPTQPEAQVGVLFIEPNYLPPMCGHSTIGLATALIETGYIEAREPVTHISLDTPAGLVRVQVEVKDNTAKSVTLRNVPSFLYMEGVEVLVPGVGGVTLDIGFGGNFYAMVEGSQVGVAVEPREMDTLLSLGKRIKTAVNEKLDIKHPEQESMSECNYVQFYAPSRRGAHSKNAVIFPPGLLDRSPCGTGTSAAMAALFQKGKVSLDQEFINESIIGTTFRGRVLAETSVGPFPAIIPQIIGSAYLMGMNTFVLDPEDPLPGGFIL